MTSKVKQVKVYVKWRDLRRLEMHFTTTIIPVSNNTVLTRLITESWEQDDSVMKSERAKNTGLNKTPSYLEKRTKANSEIITSITV